MFVIAFRNEKSTHTVDSVFFRWLNEIGAGTAEGVYSWVNKGGRGGGGGLRGPFVGII